MVGKLSITRVIGRGASIYARNFIPFTLLTSFACAPLILYTFALYGSTPDEDALGVWTFVLMICGFVLSMLASATVAYGSFRQLRGEHAGAVASFVMGVKRLVSVLAVGLLVTALVLLSFGAFVIPGIGIYTTYWLAVPVAVVEGSGMGASMKRAETLSHGNRMRIFVILTLLGVTSGTIALILGATVLSGAEMTSAKADAYLLSYLATTIVLTALQAVIMAVAYHDLRSTNEGATLDDIAAIFD